MSGPAPLALRLGAMTGCAACDRRLLDEDWLVGDMAPEMIAAFVVAFHAAGHKEA